MNGTAKENSGRSPSVRNDADVSSAKMYSLSPYQTIEFVEIVNGSKIVTDKWLKLPDGNYVNYIVGGVTYFTILTMPGTPPPPPSGTPSQIEMVLASGSTVTVKDASGNVLWSGTA